MYRIQQYMQRKRGVHRLKFCSDNTSQIQYFVTISTFRSLRSNVKSCDDVAFFSLQILHPLQRHDVHCAHLPHLKLQEVQESRDGGGKSRVSSGGVLPKPEHKQST